MKIIGNTPGEKLDMLLINPPTLDLISQENSEGLRDVPAYNVAFLATLANNSGFNVGVLDAETQKVGNVKELAYNINNANPKYLGFTVNTPTYEIVREISEQISGNTRLILGGMHPSALPEQTLRDFEGLNLYALVVGPGEDAILDILEEKDRREIPNMAFVEDSEVKYTPTKKVDKLDTYPFINRDFLINDPQQTENGLASFILSSRGCYGKCSFCSIDTIWKQGIAFRGLENIVKEIDSLNKKGVTIFRFLDDLFILNSKRSEKFYELLKIKNLDGKISLYSNSRVDVINRFAQEDLTKLRLSGFEKIGLGIESGSNKVLRKAGKEITKEEALEAVKRLDNSSIRAHCYFMLGFPYETEKEMDDTLEFGNLLKQKFNAKCVVSPYKLYPGTKDFVEIIGLNPSRQRISELIRFQTAKLSYENDPGQIKEKLKERERFTILHDENYFTPHQITTKQLEDKIRKFIIQQR